MVRAFLRVGVVIAVMTAGAVSVAAQHEEHVTAGTPQTAGAGGDAAQVRACVQSQEQVMVSADAANRRLDLARQSNQPAAMRAAIDDLQSVLSSMRTQLASCARFKAAVPAGATPGHDMSAMPGHNMSATPDHDMSAMPGHDMSTMASRAAAPGTPVTNPASTGTAPGVVRGAASGPGADAHAGHRMPGVPQTAAVDTTARRPSASPVADRHAGHAMSSPAESPATATPPPPAGHDMAHMPAHNMANMAGGAPSAAVAVDLPTGPEKLSCGTRIDPKRAPRAAYAGKTYYFCSVAERDRFVKDPAGYRPVK